MGLKMADLKNILAEYLRLHYKYAKKTRQEMSESIYTVSMKHPYLRILC